LDLFRALRSHIRQLICIALRAPAPTLQNENPEKDKGTDYEAGGGAGRLRAAVVEQRHTSLPSFNDTEAARRLLVLFALTNTPESLFRAFSSYPLDQNSTAVGGRVDGADVENDGEDSDIAKVAQCIGYATNVWEVIRPGFVNWDIIENRVKGKKRTTRVKIKAEEVSDTLSTAVIGDEAWTVLNWLVLLFEIDETRVKECGQRRSTVLFIVDCSLHFLLLQLVIHHCFCRQFRRPGAPILDGTLAPSLMSCSVAYLSSMTNVKPLEQNSCIRFGFRSYLLSSSSDAPGDQPHLYHVVRFSITCKCVIQSLVP
jgi:hypothetical protein